MLPTTSAGFEDDIDDDFVDYGVEFSVWRKLRHDEENDYVSHISGRIYETHENGRTIIERRKTLQLCQKDLAAASGIDQADISRIEHGRANPTFGTLNALARALGWHVCLAEACEPVAVSHQAHAAVG